MPPQEVNNCPYCQIGHLHAGLATYIHIDEGRIITAPDTTVQVCDVCGRQEFDSEALSRLYALTGATTDALESPGIEDIRANIQSQSPQSPSERKPSIDSQQTDV